MPNMKNARKGIENDCVFLSFFWFLFSFSLFFATKERKKIERVILTKVGNNKSIYDFCTKIHIMMQNSIAYSYLKASIGFKSDAL